LFLNYEKVVFYLLDRIKYVPVTLDDYRFRAI
jgi:hypothetical protein